MNPEKSVEEQAAALALAKNTFRLTMLDNDVFFAIAKEMVEARAGESNELPDFTCEPTLQKNEGGTMLLGVRLTYSVTKDMDGLDLSFGMFNYLQLADVNEKDGSTKLTDEFKEALERAPIDTPPAAGLTVLESWQSGWNHLARSTAGFVSLDPMTHTAELTDTLMRTSYAE